MKKSLVLGISLLILLSILPLGVFASGQRRIPVIIMFRERRDLDLVRALGGKVEVAYRFKPAVAAVIPERRLRA